MKETNECTRKEYRMMKIIAICVTIFYFPVCCITLILDSEVISDTIEVVAFLVFYLLPVVIILCWYMCYERYLQLKQIQYGQNEQEQKCRQLRSNIRSIVFAGLCTFGCALANVYFIEKYKIYWTQLCGYYVLIAVITILWVFRLCLCIKRVGNVEVGVGSQKGIKTLVGLLRIVISVGCVFYAMSRASTFAFLERVS